MMARTTGSDCGVVRNFKYIHTHLDPRWEDKFEWHIMTRMTGPDCTAVSNFVNIHTHIPLLRLIRGFRYKYH